jgi:hypothetical protein
VRALRSIGAGGGVVAFAACAACPAFAGFAALVAVSLAAEPAASAEPAVSLAEPAVSLAERWPSLPASRALSLEDQITERLTMMGNELGRHLDLLSHETFQLTVDGRRRRAQVRLGGGDAQRLSIRIAGDIQFDEINAQIHTRIDLSFRGRLLHLELPMFEMAPTTYRGDYGVELRLPLFVQKF